MPRIQARYGVMAAMFVCLASTVPVRLQERPLAVASASPSGEVGQLSDATEIRIVFSEPMVALGGAVPGAPPWLSIAPGVKANYYWSGTRTLIVTADPAAPLPYATRFTVRVDAAARSAAGRSLTSPHTFTFVTPTVRLLSADWYRKTGRFDSPAVIALRFNQPVRPSDLVAHMRVRHAPHPWSGPMIDAAARTTLARDDPDGLARFDAKVAATARVAASADLVPIQIATAWDEKRFPRTPALVVIETAAPPPPEAWLAVTIDGQLPSPDGPEKHAEQSSTLRLEPAFFVDTLPCTAGCDPSNYFGVGFRRGVATAAVARTLTVLDRTDGGPGRPVAARQSPPEQSYRPADGYRNVALQMIGFDPQPAASTWALRIDSSLQAVDGQSLGYTWMGVIERSHERPFANWAGQVWEARNGPVVPFLARNTLDAQEFLSPISPADLMPRLNAMRAPNAQLAPSVPGASRRLAGTADEIEAHGIDLRRVLGSGGTGLVWAAISQTSMLPQSASDASFGRPRSTLLQVTNLGLSVKDSPQSTLVFVTRLDNAEPVATANVAIVNANNQEVWRGATSAEGVAIAPALNLRQISNPGLLSFLVTVEKDGDVAWVGSDWSGDVNPSSFGMPYGLMESRDVLRGSIFTDRGIYTLGDELRLKSILRTDAPAGVRLLPAGTNVVMRMTDSRGREVDRRTLAVNRWSSLEWTFRIPGDGALGHYSVEISTPAEAALPSNRFRPPSVYGSFLVAAFRRPDFRVDATLDAEPAVLGTTLTGTVHAQYLFGAPIAKQPVRWSVMRGPARLVPAPIRERYSDEQFVFGYLPRDPRGELYARVAEKTETLGADGRLQASVPTEAGLDLALSYTFQGDVEGVSGQHIANRAVTTLHPASFYVGLSKPPFFVDARKGLSTSVVAADLSGAARAGVPVTVSLVREQWASERRPENPGFPVWVRNELPAGEWTITTATGPVSLPIPIRDGGCYTLRAVARDERGRPTRTEVVFYAMGGGYSAWRAEGNRIALTPERETWKPGETARILVQSPWEQATALVTTEREGIRSHRRIAITSTQDTIDVPITAADVPNLYVSVLLVKGRTSTDLGREETDPGKPGFRVGYTELTVDDAAKRLKVEVTADRKEYRPRQDVAVSVIVSDAQGRPRAGEVTLWAMDYGLLSLTDYETPDVARAIYARKQLQVQTLDNRARLIGRRTVIEPTAQGQGRGGGGGRGLGQQGQLGGVAGGMPLDFAMAESVMVQAASPMVDTRAQVADADVRRDFRPLVFWLGSVATGADGRAGTTVTLPDSLTTYRIMAVAGDLASQFGAGDSEIRTAKPLTMLPAFPRFMARGDRASFGAVLTNGTGRGGDATVTIRSLDAASLQFGADVTRTVRLAPGESVPVRFDAMARAMGRARVRMTVTLGAETDAFEMALPVIAPARLETVAAYGDTIASATEKLVIPPDIVPGAGGLTVSLASTALVGLGESARYVDEYPFDCAEQKASRALALLLSADLGGAFALASIKPDETRTAGIAALNELYSYQCPDGGFTLWPGRCVVSSPYLTAYVLDVMKIASSLKVETDRNSIDRALNYLQNQLRQPPPEVQWWPAWAATQAYAVKVLSELGRNQAADVTRLYGMAERLPIFGLSYLADALAASKDRGPRYQDVVRRLSNALRIDADRAHVEEVDDASLVWLWHSNVRATAVVLGGIARRQDDASLVAPLARWLLAARTNGRWGTTQENAVALEALVSYYRAFESETPQMTATVALAGTTVGSAKFAGRSTTAQQVRIEMPDLVKGVSGAVTRDLVVSRTGTGRVHYTARLQYLAPESPGSVDRGLRIERRYERFTPAAAGAQTTPAPNSEATTTFSNGDLVRVTLTVNLPHEGRFLAFTDPVPAGFEPIDAQLKTTAIDLAAESTSQSSARDPMNWWRRGGFEHVEKHDDRVVAFATRLAAGRHELTYLVRATTAGTFNAAGAWGEAMYAPEINGRSAASVVQVK